MRKTVHWTLVALVVFLFGAHASNVQASVYYIDDTYFDCALNEVGWYSTNCSGFSFQDGQQTGAWRFHEVTRCSDDVRVVAYWAYWDGSQWVPISGTPQPSC